MRHFAYRARNLAGRMVEGTIAANDKNHAYEQLTEDKLVPVDIRQATESSAAGLARFFSGRVRPEDLIVFTRQLATMLKAGIPILQTFEIIRDQAEKPAFKEILAGISRNLTAGSRLSEALAEYPRVFTSEYVNIVVSGETGGDLVKALFSLAQWMEREIEIRSTIKTALRYPAMVCVALVVAMIIMVVFVIPKFAAFFAKSAVPLPLPTRMLLCGNHFFQHYWPGALVLVVAAVLAGIWLLRIKPVRLGADRMKFRLHLIGPVYTKIIIARFGRIFAMLVRNGVPVLKALEIAPAVVANSYFRHLLEKVRQTIQDGNTIADGFYNEMPVLPPMVTSLIAVGEKTGSLDEMLDQVVDFYDMEINYTLKNLTALIEPVITLVIGGAVLFLALAVLLPVWNMSQILTSQVK